ncbi:Uncharacterised protein [Mycobacterium tuberculosis]|nr:Uncharacterised protein [Mycobacterium tuberculosis]
MIRQLITSALLCAMRLTLTAGSVVSTVTDHGRDTLSSRCTRASGSR